MPYVIIFYDDKDVAERKKEVRPVHLEYVTRNAERILTSGGFFPEGNDFPMGGLIVLDVGSREEAVEYIESDPFFEAGIFSRYSIERWRPFIFDRQRIPA